MRAFSGPSSFIPLALPIAILLAAPALAQIRGTYSPASTLTAGGTVSGPGFSYSNQFWSSSSTRLNGPQGNSLPVHGNLALKIENNTVIYVPKFKFLGAHLEFYLDIVVSNGSFAAIDPLANGAVVSASAAGLADTVFLPFDLGWHFKRADLQAGYGISAPTGRYVAGASNNLSNGYWTNSLQTGTTLFLSKSKATQLSIFNNYSWNTTQRGTALHPGQNDSVDYSLTQTIPLTKSANWTLQLGPAGYGQWQTTRASGQLPLREGLTYGVDAAGLTISLSTPFKSLYLGGSVLWEYHARNTYQGRTATINAGFNF